MYSRKIESLHTEGRSAGNAYRAEYVKGIETLIERQLLHRQKEREAFGAAISVDREACRAEFKQMLGWPLTVEPQPVLGVKTQIVQQSDSWQISRVQLEIFPDFWFYGLLLEHKSEAKLPLVISQHGGLGTPEVCGSFFDSGNYNDMSLRIFQKGVNVFAPQLLLWREGDFGQDARRAELDNELKRIGGSIAALEIYCIGRCLDHFAPWERFNGSFGMIGLSYGGFYSLYTAASDTRIRAALDCSFFNDGKRCYGSDFAWKDIASRFSDAEVGALVCPRALRVEWGDKDAGQCVSGAQDAVKRLEGYYAEAPQNLSFRCFDGNHEFCPEDDGIEWIIGKL